MAANDAFAVSRYELARAFSSTTFNLTAPNRLRRSSQIPALMAKSPRLLATCPYTTPTLTVIGFLCLKRMRVGAMLRTKQSQRLVNVYQLPSKGLPIPLSHHPFPCLPPQGAAQRIVVDQIPQRRGEPFNIIRLKKLTVHAGKHK